MSAVAAKPSPVSNANSFNDPSSRCFNFSAGPGCLPEEVIQQAQQDLWNIAGSGVGICEHSHRAKVYDKILAEAEADCRKIGNIPANYKVLFLTGGATSQNFMVPANLLAQNETADYLTTGYWAEKSAEQAKLYGTINEAWDGRGSKHTYIPTDAEIKYSAKPSYVHMCSNNTIYGTEWRASETDASWRLPKVPAGVPLVCDMSSDLFCRPTDFTKFGLVYAGAQKNIGIAGTTLVVIHEDLLKRNPRELPLMLQYRVHAKDESRHNTPPVFAIYFSGLVFKWILKQGGLEALFKRNVEKAQLIYDVLDSSSFYKAHARKDSRSLMNITFRCPTAELDDKFIAEAKAQGMDQLKGHRATGGMRASTYNAFPRAGCEALAQFMREFERKNG
ncbi:MAG TPA: 3-phosphoserine/phosphohydroxythreonine transaminase [Phycisphaerales bacterium]|nr:3-phosphoserine/phosphohydroxythreonine transaminase [Phycisphaerales bacterium]